MIVNLFVLCCCLIRQLIAPCSLCSLFSSVCPSVFVIHPTPRWTSWLWPVMSQLSLRMGPRLTALRKAAVSTELWTMRRTASPTPTLFSTSCCSWHHSTSWWRSPTGTGRPHTAEELLLLHHSTSTRLEVQLKDKSAVFLNFCYCWQIPWK